MDSTNDAANQLGSYLRRDKDFCDNPYCIGTVWHEWGCCSTTRTATSLATTLLHSNSTSTTTRMTDSTSATETDLVHEPGRSLENTTTELLGMCKYEAATAPSAPAQPTSRFAAPVSDTTVAKARIDSVPKKTREDSAYCVRLWQETGYKQLI